ncbi:hypothetical protein, partial [Xanthomonas sacchari]|uniref:hypothetical protein n=1 Tax=Xanthomonas sacchari TaxID=56458 RepID=UPI00225E0E4E
MLASSSLLPLIVEWLPLTRTYDCSILPLWVFCIDRVLIREPMAGGGAGTAGTAIAGRAGGAGGGGGTAGTVFYQMPTNGGDGRVYGV